MDAATIVKVVTDAIGGTLGGVGTAVVDFFDGVVVGAQGGMTTFATWTLTFLGVSFGLGAIGWVVGKVRGH